MVVYSVHWHIVPENIKYANRLIKSFFRQDLCFSDGEVVYKRMKIDSRGFNPNYLYVDDIKEPIRLYYLKSNRNIF